MDKEGICRWTAGSDMAVTSSYTTPMGLWFAVPGDGQAGPDRARCAASRRHAGAESVGAARTPQPGSQVLDALAWRV